jgi:hypothetical protein
MESKSIRNLVRSPQSLLDSALFYILFKIEIETAQLYPELEPALYRRSSPRDSMAAIEPLKRKLLALFVGEGACLEAVSVRLPSKEKVKSLHGVSFTFGRCRRSVTAADPSMTSLCIGSVIQSFAGVERALHFPGQHQTPAGTVSSCWAVFECENSEIWLNSETFEWRREDTPTQEIESIRAKFGLSAPVSLIVCQSTDPTLSIRFNLLLATNTLTGDLLQIQ